MVIGAGALVVVGLILVIVGLVVASLSALLWVGIAVAVVGGVLFLVNYTQRGRRVP
jgi:hypothetical protein